MVQHMFEKNHAFNICSESMLNIRELRGKTYVRIITYVTQATPFPPKIAMLVVKLFKLL